MPIVWHNNKTTCLIQFKSENNVYIKITCAYTSKTSVACCIITCSHEEGFYSTWYRKYAHTALHILL